MKTQTKPVYIKGSHSKKKGAVVVEYVLLIVACLGVAILIAKTVDIGADESESGVVIKAWMAVLKTIAEDI